VVKPDDTPESLAQRIHQLEYKFYPLVIEELLQGLDLPPGAVNQEQKYDPVS
jgi:folate-dependent phosphoribosylglycinamide formyltransferase PurN